jgi:hypothetical protein
MKQINWMLFIFNMVVPLFPMDGARLLRAFLSMRWEPQKTTYNLCLLGLFTAGFMACLYVMGWFIVSPMLQGYGFFFFLIAMFGVQSCLIEMWGLQWAEVYPDPAHNREEFRAVVRRLRHPLRGVASRRPVARIRVIRPAADSRREAAEPALSERDRLLAELEKAVEGEDFVRAAQIRDQLKNLAAETHKA